MAEMTAWTVARGPRPRRATKPARRKSIPSVVVDRYPQRRARRPPATLEKVHVTMNGVSTTPAVVADPPMTPWTKSGMYAIAPNMLRPRRNPPTDATVTIRFAKRLKGRNGCSARRSVPTNSAARSAVAAVRPALGREAHGKAWPPPTRRRRNAVALPARRPAPA